MIRHIQTCFDCIAVFLSVEIDLIDFFYVALFKGIAFFAVIAVAAGRALLPNQSADAQAETVRQDASVNVDNFQYVYQTSNGIVSQNKVLK